MFLISMFLEVAVAAPLTADEVVRYALVHDPGAVAAHAEVAVADAERRSVGLLSANPRVEARVSSDAVDVQAVQPLSLTGEGWSARRAASLDAAAATAAARRADLVIAAEVRSAWMHAAVADRRAALAEELLDLAGSLRLTVEARARASEASVLEVNLARVTEARAVADALAMRAEAAERRQALAAFHPDALAAELGDPEEALPAATATQNARADVTAAGLDVKAARAGLRRERASVLPAVGIGAWVETTGEEAAIGPFVEAEIPLFTFRQGAVAAARSRLAVAEARQAQIGQVATAEQITTAAVADAAREDVARIEGVDEAARQALVAIGRGFDAGELDLSTSVLLRTEVFDGWIASLDARAAAVDAGLAALLAREDPALVPPSP